MSDATDNRFYREPGSSKQQCNHAAHKLGMPAELCPRCTPLARGEQLYRCPVCECNFVQPFVCTTCGAQRLYDETVRSQAATIELLRWSLSEVRREVVAVTPDWARAIRIIDQVTT